MDKRLQKVIDFFKEEMVANAAGPVAGFDPVMGKKISRRRSIGSWAQSLQKKKKK